MNADGTIVIIGGSSGIGLAAARRCLADGAPVVIAGRSPERLEAAAELGHPARLTAVAADIGDQDQLTRLFDQAGALTHLVITAPTCPTARWSA